MQLRLERTFNVLHSSSDGPAFLSARRVEGKKGSRIEAEGDAELRRSGQAIFADHLIYQQDSRDVVADGAVRIEQNGDVLSGMRLEYNLDTRVGDMTKAQYQLAESNARGGADRVHMDGKGNYFLSSVTYTTCPVGNDDWQLDMGRLDIDRTTQIGVAHSAVVEFKGVPILYSPWMDFPLKGQRKTGFLAPLFGSTTKGGAELTLPFYLNLAPNYDATIAPRYMAKRGLLLNNEFRYLSENYYGEMQLDNLQHDQLTQTSRSHQAYKHSHNLGGGFSDTVNLNRVSDNAYYRDLATTVAGTSQVNLLREGALNYAGGWWNATTRVQGFQTLQDPLAPVSVPYKRSPQVLVTAQREVHDANATFSGEYVNFSHPTSLNAQRVVLFPSVSYPLLYDSGYYLTPKFAVHSADYIFGQNNLAAQPNVRVSVPIFSLDSGMAFEHDLSIAGNNLVQTLEPRAYYVYIPYRNQDMLPNFDSALSTFSYSQIFTENRFLGGDRVGDANQVTLAATSRLIDADNGAELIRGFVGERFSFAQPRVNLVVPTAATPAAPPGTPTTSTNKSDILAGLSGRPARSLWFDTMVQYNPSGLGAEMYSISGRYQPEPGKVLNLGYRFTSPNINPNLSMRQVDISEQWPLWGRWTSVARWNYSMLEKRMLEGLLGLEYNQACWVARIVMQRFTTSTQQVSTSIFVQLDLTGLAGVGSDPMEALRRSVPGYTKLNQNVPDVTGRELR
ncbi:MAG TPA: LPS-assembly protein LptD [Gallionellaceae bacterium]